MFLQKLIFRLPSKLEGLGVLSLTMSQTHRGSLWAALVTCLSTMDSSSVGTGDTSSCRSSHICLFISRNYVFQLWFLSVHTLLAPKAYCYSLLAEKGALYMLGVQRRAAQLRRLLVTNENFSRNLGDVGLKVKKKKNGCCYLESLLLLSLHSVWWWIATNHHTSCRAPVHPLSRTLPTGSWNLHRGRLWCYVS